ncbi:hypothetical protein [Cytobacillus purgationiresistens]|uniref:DUF2207 domain-containing protein n=1 Tax=Cytobacillus purgationiresistens TaxID=863449 RepID=A0ABU0AB08_9BACI|nr:hypothetical protein [Cytobacillus purgationiresistens]MDQ0268437.1 hypothetical protein [Cytobacillus purgationiresistens]
MGMFLFIGAIVLLIIVVSVVGFNSSTIKPLKNLPLPPKLGVESDKVNPIVNKLDASLSTNYKERLKQRVLKENPKWADHEFEWAYFELNRYFVMNSLLKSVPMFSDKVDDVWHEMLMFTREYEQFSKAFYGDYLHHSPNAEGMPMPGERALFDWMYLSLFAPTENSRKIWGGFLQSPIPNEILNDFELMNDEQLLVKYFRSNNEWMEIKMALIQKLKKEIFEARAFKREDKQPDRTNSDKDVLSHTALGAVIFFSIYHNEDFTNQMAAYLPEEWLKQTSAGGASCSGFACASDLDHHHSNDGGGSSDASCGSGCSSS